MRGLISVFAGLLATTEMPWAEPCRVAQTPTLNVHGEPKGRIVGTLNEGTMVSMSSVITVCGVTDGRRLGCYREGQAGCSAIICFVKACRGVGRQGSMKPEDATRSMARPLLAPVFQAPE